MLSLGAAAFAASHTQTSSTEAAQAQEVAVEEENPEKPAAAAVEEGVVATILMLLTRIFKSRFTGRLRKSRISSSRCNSKTCC